MRRPLGPDQRRRVEGLVREKEERCGLCGSTGLRCGEDAATQVGGGLDVRVLCTDTGAEAHAGGFAPARDYSVTTDEARRVGPGYGPPTKRGRREAAKRWPRTSVLR